MGLDGCLRRLLNALKVWKYLRREQICGLIQASNWQIVFSFSDPLTRGSACWPHWGLHSQIPIIDSRSAPAMWLTQLMDTSCVPGSGRGTKPRTQILALMVALTSLDIWLDFAFHLLQVDGPVCRCIRSTNCLLRSSRATYFSVLMYWIFAADVYRSCTFTVFNVDVIWVILCMTIIVWNKLYINICDLYHVDNNVTADLSLDHDDVALRETQLHGWML